MAKELLKLRVHHRDRNSTDDFRFARFVGQSLSALALLLCSCSRFAVEQADINRDAASRCVQNIDAWKKDLAKLDMLEEEFDLISAQIRHDYSKAAPEEKTKLRARVADVVREMDQTTAEADALIP